MRPHLSDALLAAQTDERLVALTRAGHERAFAAIVERYRGPLVGFAGRIAPDSRAEDIVQQALTSAWAALAAGAEVAHVRGWLHQIVRHEAIRLAKQEGRAIVDPLEGEEVLARGAAAVEAGSGTAAGARRRGPWRRAGLTARNARDAAEVAAERERVRDAFAGIADLPESQREALVQTTLAGRSRSEVAAALGLSEGAVRQLVHRARTALRTAATAFTPLPLANWAASGGDGGARLASALGDGAGNGVAALGNGGGANGLAASLGSGGGHGIAEAAAGAGGATLAGIFAKAGVAVVATGALAGGVTVAEHRSDHRPPPAQTEQATRGAAAGPAPAPSTSGPAADRPRAGGGVPSAATPIAFGGAARGDGERRDRAADDRSSRHRRDSRRHRRPERAADGGRADEHRGGDRPTAPVASPPAAATPRPARAPIAPDSGGRRSWDQDDGGRHGHGHDGVERGSQRSGAGSQSASPRERGNAGPSGSSASGPGRGSHGDGGRGSGSRGSGSVSHDAEPGGASRGADSGSGSDSGSGRSDDSGPSDGSGSGPGDDRDGSWAREDG